MIDVKIFSLDYLVFELDYPEPDILKIDVEGNESRVVTGMTRMLKECRPVILCETHSLILHREVLENLKKHSYLVNDLKSGRPAVATPEIFSGRRYLIATPGH